MKRCQYNSNNYFYNKEERFANEKNECVVNRSQVSRRFLSLVKNK